MRQQAVLKSCACQCDLEVSVGEFLQIMSSVEQRIVVRLHHVLCHHGDDHLRVFGVVLVPGAVPGLAKAGECDRGNGDDIESFRQQPVSERSVEISGGFQSYPDRAGQAFQKRNEPIMVNTAIGYFEGAPVAAAVGCENNVPLLATSMATRLPAGLIFLWSVTEVCSLE